MARTTTSRSRSVGTAWKAVAAAGVGVVLLGAGGATFAEWSDNETSAAGTAITSGVLDLASGEGTWTNAADVEVTADIESGSYAIVPGDALTYRETLTVDAKGDLLRATVSHNLKSLGGDAELIAQLDTRATMTLNGQLVEGASAPVVADDEKQMLAVAVTVTFDEDTKDLIGQGKSVELGGLDVTLTQDTVTAGN